MTIVTPKYNPKHKKKRVIAPTQKSAQKFARNRKIITLIVIAGVIGVSIVGIFIGKSGYDGWKETHIQKEDEVTVELRIWKANDDGDNVSNVIWHQNKTYTIKETANETGIPYGLWDQLIGMEVNETDNRLFLPRCVDDMKPIDDVVFHEEAVAFDGWDDRYKPGRRIARCYSYGYDTTGELGVDLRFTPIIYWIKILNLKKGV